MSNSRLSKGLERISLDCMNGRKGFLEYAVFREDCHHDVEGRLYNDLR